MNFQPTYIESSLPNYPKILHWFSWGQKKINIYDIVTNTT